MPKTMSYIHCGGASDSQRDRSSNYLRFADNPRRNLDSRAALTNYSARPYTPPQSGEDLRYPASINTGNLPK
jgi:hypothetical protein